MNQKSSLLSFLAISAFILTIINTPSTTNGFLLPTRISTIQQSPAALTQIQIDSNSIYNNSNPLLSSYPKIPTRRSGSGSGTSSPNLFVLFGKRGNGKVKNKNDKKRVKKENLPEKICVVCQKPFTWRKKWERSWDEVTCCSKSCNAKRKNDDY